MQIGDVVLKNNIVLAPMAGISDMPLRLLAKEGGAGLVYSEMVSAKAIFHGDEKTKRLLRTADEERPIAVQIFGSDPETVAGAAKIIADLGADIVDINLGCPARKIAKSGSGVKLLSDEKILGAILERTVKSVDIPVTIKTRIGLVPGQNVAREIVALAYNCGIKAAAVHGRYASQGHSGGVDFEALREVCRISRIPIIANGGILNEMSAKQFLGISGCDGLMIGRGAIGNYSIFERLKNYFESGKISPAPSIEQRLMWLKRHAENSFKHYSNEKGLIVMRKVFHFYIKGLPNSSAIRNKFNAISTMGEFEKLLNEIRKAGGENE
jgi:tRNA-dihydrouridine synthase B